MDLTLREATEADAGQLLTWRNDPGTVAAGVSGTVEPAEHRLWLRRRLADPDTRLYIVQADGRPAGSLRLERRDPACAELSITLAPDARGRGLGRAAIRLGVEQARDALGVSTVLARVREDNPRSVRAFAAVGFVAQRNADGLIEMSRALACAP